ncbi:uncharacterized protein LOC119113387 [Pollicipes pollicipes]|uniref:uncharacterized protein LOC119113387 n=1 Tax=Pollicipes pollicipes TaxID=41117 RepID=UPI001885817D|nr:uncharacterized protein LOC119113387 [Pollicipes pollicipes]
MPVRSEGMEAPPPPLNSRQPGVVRSPLHDGSVFKGYQKSKGNCYDVEVELKKVDLDSAYLCGYLKINNLTDDFPTMVTYFDGEIIGRRHPFLTRKWDANEEVDRKHWGKFEAFSAFSKSSTRTIFDYDALEAYDSVFMRWKESFLIPDIRYQSLALPEKISTDEQRELLELLLKTHELEIENMEIRSNQLIKDHELRRRDLMILRYDRQRALCDEIISRQRDFIQDIESGRSPNGGDMPPELQKMYSLYQQELQGPSAQRDQRFLNGLNEVMRSPSTLSMMSSVNQDGGRLPPIGTDRDEKLFQHLGRRSSVDFDNKRPQTPLSLRSPNR